MSSAAALLVLALTGGQPGADALVIESDSACPSAEAVRDALAALRPPIDWPRATVVISARPQSLLVALGSGGAGPRQVPVGDDCAARAATAAVIIATWLGDLPGEKVGAPILQPASPASSAAVPLPPAASPTSPPGLGLHEMGLGGLAAFGGGAVPGLRLEYVQHRWQRWFGWQASLVLTAPHAVAVGGGTTRWTRVAATLAAHGRLAGKRYFVGGDGGVATAYTAAWGREYPTNQTDQSLTVGFAAGLRGGIPWGRLRIWTDVHAFAWLYGQSVQIDGGDGLAPDKLSLPTWDVQWALGASWLF